MKTQNFVIHILKINIQESWSPNKWLWQFKRYKRFIPTCGDLMIPFYFWEEITLSYYWMNIYKSPGSYYLGQNMSFLIYLNYGYHNLNLTNGDKFGCLWTNGGGESISIALKEFCNKRGKRIGYAAFYIREENGITKHW